MLAILKVNALYTKGKDIINMIPLKKISFMHFPKVFHFR